MRKKQLEDLKRLWFLYGNRGKFHTDGNHKIIQRVLEHEHDSIDVLIDSLKESIHFYPDISPDCFYQVFKIITEEE